eukprot:scaffold19276_cov82-Skeletonema_dohrnii-CCMP3373.AAC.1
MSSNIWKAILGGNVHYFLLFVVDVVIGSIAWGVLVFVFVFMFGLAVVVATIISADPAAGRAI